MPDETPVQPNAADYDLTLPDGHNIDAKVVDGWKATFRQAGLSSEQAQRVLDWHARLTQQAAQHQRERELLAPHEAQAQAQRRDELTRKRYSPGGLTTEEGDELRSLYATLVEARERGPAG
jgi:hypothetical protein